MHSDFHARPTSPVPPSPAVLRQSRPGARVARPAEPARASRNLEPVAPAIAPVVLVDRTQAAPPVAPEPIRPARPALPELRFGREAVDAKGLRARGTKLWTVVGVAGAVMGILAAAASTMGMALLALLFAPVVDYFRARKVRALLNGSGLRVNERQLPELHACVVEFASRLGLKELPSVYVVEAAMHNGFAARIGRKDVVLLTDDVVWGSLVSKDPRSLGFIVGHELAHVALGHTGTFRSIMRTVVKPLGRLDELSCDNVARALVGDDQIAFEGVKVLAVGPQLSAYVEDDELVAQAYEVVNNRQTKKAERNLTHPLVMRRVANILG